MTNIIQISAERSKHKGKSVIKLIFDIDAGLTALVRQIYGARWSQTMRCWHVPDTPQSVKALREKFGNVISDNAISDIQQPKSADYTSEYKPLLLRFSNYMKERRYSERTIEHYTERLRIFFCFCRKNFLEITNEDVDKFNQNYILRNKLSATYQSQFVSALKLFYEKIPRKKLNIGLLERPKRGKYLPEIMTKEDVARLINSTNNLKHRAMLSLIYSCGLRRNELLNMKIADIDSKRNLISIRHAKGDKDRLVPLSPKILEMLREYYKQYKPVTWLFEGQFPDTPYTGISLHNVFTGALKKAGIEGPFSLHTLRHCFATHLLENGVNLRYIQELLGHRYMKTTEIYMHVSAKNVQDIKSPFDNLDL
ncbi:MAG: site-specific integrase [Prevotellaceae bacterium]|jgi:integrase/recombinase XerD|nr:site-specific integrase [Prevotellaceae bacterium]